MFCDEDDGDDDDDDHGEHDGKKATNIKHNINKLNTFLNYTKMKIKEDEQREKKMPYNTK